PSMKSKMFATIMITPASTNRPSASAHAAMTLMTTPMKVRTFGWMRSRTQAPMMARSGNMHTAPMAPVKVIRPRGPHVPVLLTWTDGVGTAELIMEGSDTERNRDIIAYSHPRTQGADRPAAGAAWSLSVLQRGRQHHLHGQGARA